MERTIDSLLENWVHSKRRKPLILRGARQVGKTYAVKALANTCFRQECVVIDFEKMISFKNIFEHDLDVKRILADLELLTNTKIIPGKTLLFFDEIQHCPQALMSLRYFYEEMPELHLIAAGSLLEFILSEISFPVGRVQFLNLYPLSFNEYLRAIKKDNLAALLQQKPQPVSETIHAHLRQELYRYFIVGGMPEAVQAYADTRSLRESRAVHMELLHAFRNDFAKYTPKVDPFCLNEVFASLAKDVGQQIQYSKLAADFSGPTMKNAVNLLNMAQLVSLIHTCNPPVMPLEASARLKTFKAIILDIGLMQTLAGVPVNLEDAQQNLLSLYRGALAEQFVAQELRMVQEEGRLYYWQRAEKSSTAEVDLLAVHQNQVIPIEVKSGKGGSLRSLHLFLEHFQQSPYGFIFLDAPYQQPQNQLIYLPLYWVQGALTN